MKRLIAAVAIATAVSTTALWAQTDEEMGHALSMLETAAAKELTKIGLTDVDPMSLSLNQLAQIRYIMGTSDYSENDKTAQIKRIVAGD